ncbi:MAG: nucleotidyltransferase family protein [Elusimicrobiales bacterium]|nr:nucleotidyltransferase family protein [Elusimicrobiales bacterium]
MDKAAAAREILLLGALAEARAAAAAAGVELVPLKGAALLELGLYQPGERGMTDADVLVRPRDLELFEKVLRKLGYQAMPDSADAWFRPCGGSAPPAILDVHTGLWHIRDTEELFSWGLEPVPGGLRLNLADLFIHAAVHPLLHHGELTARALEDCARLAASAAGSGEKFWALVARKAAVYGLRPALWPAVRRLAAGPAGVPSAALAALEPRGPEKIKAALFEKAAKKHSTVLEYLLPVLNRPALLVRYAVPEKRFMLRRYGAVSAALYLLRPFKLVWSILRR